MRYPPALTEVAVPCPRCAQPIGLPVTVVAVDRDDHRVRFHAVAPPAIHRCPDLSEGWL